MIIAEIGQNHCGDMSLARELVRRAEEGGADLAKFQLYDHKVLYAGKNIPDAGLSKEQACMLFNYGKEIGIEVFFSVFDVEKVKWCEEMGVKRYKVAYSQRNNKELELVIPHKPTYVSCDAAEDYHAFFDHTNVKELYCASKYDADIGDLDFTGRTDSWDSTNTFDIKAGYSDHTVGLDACKIALSRGAEIIEKHFCIEHDIGIDAEWSMNIDELKELKRFESVVREVL